MRNVLLVTGASSDIGCALIEAMKEDDFVFLAHYRTPNSRLQVLAEELGERLILLQADFSSEEQTRELVKKIDGTGYVPTHFLHLPAAKFTHTRFPKLSYRTFEEGFQISFRSAVILSQAFVPRMAKNKSGHVVFMLSQTVTEPTAYCAAYVTGKYALLGLMQTLCAEYRDKNIVINAISPSYVDTNFIKDFPDMIRQAMIDKTPGRQMLTPEEVASVIRVLLRGELTLKNGENTPINTKCLPELLTPQ